MPTGIELEHALHLAHVGQDQVALGRHGQRAKFRVRLGQELAAVNRGTDVAPRARAQDDEHVRRVQRPAGLEEVAAGETCRLLDHRHVVDRHRGLAVPLVEDRELVGLEVLRQVGDGAAVELERLPPTGDRARGARPGQCCPVGLRSKTGPLEVHRRVDLRRADQERPELGRAGVEMTQLGRPDGGVQRVPEELVAEVIEAAIEEVEREQERLLDQLGERRLQVGDRTIQAAGKDLGHEAATDDGPRPSDRARVVREAPDAREHRILDRVGNLGGADRATVRPGVLVQRGEQLLDVEGNAVRALVHGGDDLARCRQAGPQDEGDDERRLVLREGLEARFLGQSLADQPRPPLAVHRSERQLVQAVGPEQEQRPLAPEARQLADDFEAELVGPLEIFEGEQRRLIDGLDDAVCDLVHEHPARPQRVRTAAALERQQVGAQRPERRVVAHRAREVQDGGERHEAVVGGEVPIRDAIARGLGLAQHGGHHPRLADAGLTG